MHVFVTGSTGFVGTSVVRELLAHGHSVVGLTRSDTGEAQLRLQGAVPLRGDLKDVALLQKTAASCDGAIHLAFQHENFANFAAVCVDDRAAIKALGDGLASTADGTHDRALVVTSGTGFLKISADDTAATETSEADMSHPMAVARAPSEGVCLGFTAHGVRASVVRLPPSTHGAGGRSGFAGILVGMALANSVSAYVDDSADTKAYTWSAGHRDDAARLYRLALEKGGRGPEGAIYHAVAEEAVPLREIAIRAGAILDVPVKVVPAADAAAHFGWFSFGMTIRNVVSSAQTQAALGWTPVGPTLMEDLPAVVAFAKEFALNQ